MVVTILWWTIRVSVTMDTKRTPVRHLVVMATILALVILAYVYVSNTSTPTRLEPATIRTSVIARGNFADKTILENDRDDSDEVQNPPSITEPFVKSSDPLPRQRESLEFFQQPNFEQQTNRATRQERCAKCFQPRIVPIIPARYLCRPTEIAGNVDIVTLIFSHISHRTRRDAIRQTWGSLTKQNTAILRHVFVLGLSPDAETNIAIQLENKEFLDVLQFDFLDSYANLTLKTLGAFKWAIQRCPNAKHVVKTDDDVWLNLQRLLWVLPRYDLVKAIGGHCLRDSIPIRDPKSKWYVSYQTYRGKKYPPFCSGTGYVLQMQTVKDVLKIAPNVPFYPLEDVYIGLCLEQLGYRTQSLPGFHNTLVHFDPCTYRKTVVTSHNVNEELLHWAWNSDCHAHPYLLDNNN